MKQASAWCGDIYFVPQGNPKSSNLKASDRQEDSEHCFLQPVLVTHSWRATLHTFIFSARTARGHWQHLTTRKTRARARTWHRWSSPGARDPQREWSGKQDWSLLEAHRGSCKNRGRVLWFGAGTEPRVPEPASPSPLRLNTLCTKCLHGNRLS